MDSSPPPHPAASSKPQFPVQLAWGSGAPGDLRSTLCVLTSSLRRAPPLLPPGPAQPRTRGTQEDWQSSPSHSPSESAPLHHGGDSAEAKPHTTPQPSLKRGASPQGWVSQSLPCPACVSRAPWEEEAGGIEEETRSGRGPRLPDLCPLQPHPPSLAWRQPEIRGAPLFDICSGAHLSNKHLRSAHSVPGTGLGSGVRDESDRVPAPRGLPGC